MGIIEIDTGSPVAPYEQVRSGIATGIASGGLHGGARLPTVRQLAADLHLAVNTVARAYRLLEADGLVVTRGRHGTFVRSEVIHDAGQRSSTARAAADAYVGAVRALGLTATEAAALVELAWSEQPG